jgi:hypothetical protein
MTCRIARVKHDHMQVETVGNISLQDAFPFVLSFCSFCREKNTFRRAQVLFAQQGRYRSYEHPTGTKILGLWKDIPEETWSYYRCTIASDDDIHWNETIAGGTVSDHWRGPPGPFVPVTWDEEGTWSIYPLSLLFSVPDLSSSLARQRAKDADQRELRALSKSVMPIANYCWLESLQSASKMLQGADAPFGCSKLESLGTIEPITVNLLG